MATDQVGAGFIPPYGGPALLERMIAMIKRNPLLLILILSFSLTPALVAGAAAQIKIAFISDITGPASSLGIPERNTGLMLQEELEAKGGIKGRPVKVVIYDGESRETPTLLAVKKAIEEDRVAAVICCTQSGTSLAVIDTVTKAKVPMVSMAASIKIVEPVKDRYWVFKTVQSDSLMSEVYADHFLKRGINKVAFMNVDNAFGHSGRVEFEKVAKARGITVTRWEKFGDKDVDMTPQLTRIAGTDAQAILVWAIPPAASVVTKNHGEMGLKLPLFASGAASKVYIDLAGKASEGVRLAIVKILAAEQLPDSDPQKPVLLSYIRDYERRFGAGTRNIFGGHAWDAVKLVYHAIEKALERGANPDDLPAFRQAVRDEIERARNFVGITGVFNFSPADHNGLDRSAMVMLEIVGGRWKLID